MANNAYEIYPVTYLQLLKLIRQYALVTDKLPSEEALAKQLGVGRPKIRDIMAEMETNGYVIRKRGVGTLINKYVLAEKARIDVDNIFEDMITDLGYRPRTQVKKIMQCEEFPDLIRDSLQLGPKEHVYKLEKVLYADNVPVIYLEDYIPGEFFDSRDINIDLLTTSTYIFVQHFCDQLLDSLIAHIEAVVADETLGEIMQLPRGAPLLKLFSVCYSQALHPMLASVEYYNTQILPMSFSKRTILSKKTAEGKTRPAPEEACKDKP